MKRRYTIYVFLFTLTAINYIDRVALSVASSDISREFGLGPVSMGYLFSSFLWLYMLALIPMGIMVDKVGSKRLNAWGIGFWSFATALTAGAVGFVSLLTTRFLMGLGESTTYPAGGRVIREWIPAPERGIATAVFHSGSLVGPAVGAVGLGWLVGTFGWRVAFLVAAALGFVWLAAWLVWFEAPEKARWLGTAERDYILGSRDGTPGVAVVGAERASLGLRGLVRSRTLWSIAFSHGCVVYTTYLFLTWLPGYLRAEKGMTLVSSGFYTAVPCLGAAVLGVLIGRAGDAYLAGQDLRSGPRRVVVASCMAISALILLVPYVDALWMVVLLLTLSLTGCTAAVAANLSLVNDLVPSPADSGTAIGFISTGGNLFGLAAPIVTGYVISLTGRFGAGFVIAGTLVAVAALVTLFLTRSPVAEVEAVADVRTA